ncbi:hypothetical protein Q9L58_002800 [Maublancomyces gigas]|uniref:Uncharacterized protein n=1 Tax=Discina gigas TaxID=1032678 RepID=A0ABR3GR29_9PEZI
MLYQSQISLLQAHYEVSSHYLVVLELEVQELRKYIDSHSLPSPISRAGLISPSPLAIIAFEIIRRCLSSVQYKVRARKLEKKLLGLRKYIINVKTMQGRYEKVLDADPALRASLDGLDEMFNENYKMLEELIGDITQLRMQSKFVCLM